MGQIGKSAQACYAVADSLRHFAPASGGDPDLWEAVGLLHDMDYERDPNLNATRLTGIPSSPQPGCANTAGAKKFAGLSSPMRIDAGVARVTPLEQTLYAVDELSGFVMAVARVRPSKSIQEVDVAAVKKKMKDKAFARAVNREDIICGAAKLGRPLEEVIAGVITALQADAERLGLGGSR